MSTTTRTDVHSPTNMDPAQYEYMFAFDCEDGFAFANDREGREQADAAADNPAGKGLWRCAHCGAHIRYHAVLRYLPTGEYIFVGETCVDNRFSLQSKAEFDRLRKAAELDRVAQRIVKAALECLDTLDLPEAAERFLSDKKGTTGHPIARDIRRKLWLYGSISQKQADLVAKLTTPKPATDDAEAEVLVEVPEGRLTIEGTVLTTKWQESDFGGSLKMLVKVTTPQGVYKLWGSVPSAISPERGDFVKFMAQVTAKETGFGFFKRPTQAQVVRSPSPWSRCPRAPEHHLYGAQEPLPGSWAPVAP
jgi:hypothetical protein